MRLDMQEKSQMNTFDVFDTLVARRYITSQKIWEIIESEFKITDFSKKRPLPDDGSKSFREIYECLCRNNYIPSGLIDILIKREIELEISNCYGIKENMDLVNHGDILISDMYLPPHVILQIVRSCGLNKQVTIYQSNNDKGNGKVWKDLKNYPPEFHLGDNEHSDINQALNNKIYAKYTSISKLNQLEIYLADNKLKHISLLIREIRLSNKISKDFLAAASLNLPLLFIFCEQIYRKFQSKDIFFLGRDCQILWNLYNHYYSTCYYLPFSRRVAYCQPELACNYLRNNLSDDYILIDLSSTGGTWKKMSEHGNFNVCSILFADSKSDKIYDQNALPNSFLFINPTSKIGVTNLNIELFNCANHGMCSRIEYINDKLLKIKIDQNELSQNHIFNTHEPISQACGKHIFYKNDIRDELKALSDDQLVQIASILIENICAFPFDGDVKIDHSKKEKEYFQFLETIK